MSEHNGDSFREKNLKQKIGTVVGVTLFIAVVLGFIIGIYLLGMAGIFELLGIQYTSVWSLIIFVVSFFCSRFYCRTVF
ncbi:YrvL family regulatory protein [Oceanobacillus massiliensis]|uniref:YrvL family regulatory protein n=1 Tax=Oceanobacillus massiliensis TaxID=1465765 RepID=UPI000288944F|nr:YrvL family regulatory protein [Oceanobacillus massiliensis]